MKIYKNGSFTATLLSSLPLTAGVILAAVTQTWITFESVPGVTAKTNYFDGSGSPENARLSNQLQNTHGVSFRSSAPYIILVNLGNGHATSGLNGIAGVTAGHVLKYNEPIHITFTMPGSPTVPAVTDFVSIRGDQHPATGSAKMEAFDPDGQLIGAVTAPDIKGGLSLSLAVSNIHSVRLTQTRSDIAFDDLKFNELRPLTSERPTASAGDDRHIHAGEVVALDGGGSSDDNTPTDDLIFAWVMTGRPAGSSAALEFSDTRTPQFTADVAGEYLISLIVTDDDGQPSEPDTIVISSLNTSPIADAGMYRSGFAGKEITLDASASYDPDSDPLTFSWAVTSPDGTQVVLYSNSSPVSYFTPSNAGTYLASVTVSDAFGGTSNATVTIVAIDPGDFVADQIAAVIDLIRGLSGEQVTNNGNRRALQRFLTQALEALRSGDEIEAINKLMPATDRTDGCALRGRPDGNGSGRDWVTDCGAQIAIYEKLTAALNALNL